jgi:hypothetical protein
MSVHLHTLLMVISIALAYLWLQHPVLSFYSLQAFALSAFLYLVIKRLNKAKFWHIAPSYVSIEMLLATFSFLLLVGATGNTASPLYPLVYLHLFFLVLACHVSTSLVVTGVLMLFHFAVSPNAFPEEISALLAIPLMTMLFLFTKHQHEEVVREKTIIDADEQEIALLRGEESVLTNFLTTFVTQKIGQLKQLANFAANNQEALLGQLTLLEIEVTSVLNQVNSGAVNQETDSAPPSELPEQPVAEEP